MCRRYNIQQKFIFIDSLNFRNYNIFVPILAQQIDFL